MYMVCMHGRVLTSRAGAKAPARFEEFGRDLFERPSKKNSMLSSICGFIAGPLISFLKRKGERHIGAGLRLIDEAHACPESQRAWKAKKPVYAGNGMARWLIYAA